AAVVHGGGALLDGEVLPQDLAGILDLAAAGAGKIAAEEGLEHENERVARPSLEALPENVAGHRPHLRDRYAHSALLDRAPPPAQAGPTARVSSAAFGRGCRAHSTTAPSGRCRTTPVQKRRGSATRAVMVRLKARMT